MGRKGVRARGNSIVLDFTFNGVRCRETLTIPPTPANLKYAERKRQAVLHDIELGKYSHANHFPKSKKIASLNGNCTVENALNSYLDAKKRVCAYSTWRDYYSAVNAHLTPSFGGHRIDELTTADVRAWIGRQTISNKRINNILVPLRGMLADAFADGLIDRDPMARIKNLTIRQDEPDPFTPDEITKILAVLPDQSRNLFQFAFWSGLRTSELIALEWDDIDLPKGLVNVHRASVRKRTKETKTLAGNRAVKLLEQAREALQNQNNHSQEGQIFTNPRTGIPWETDGQIRKTSWIPALKTAGVRYRCPYQTRHTYASMLLSVGENPMWVASQMGHSDWGMIRKRYGRWIPDFDKEAGKKIASFGTKPSQGEIND